MTLRLVNQIYDNENQLYASLQEECIIMHGDDFMYIPRTLIGYDRILGEDRLSQFNDKFPIIMYLETVDGWEGSGAMMSKFGLQVDHQATLIVGRNHWHHRVGQHGKNILPDKPNEGDLLYYPRTKSLFEIMFVKDDNPFYQIGELYIWKLTVEKFRYSSEEINTGEDEIDYFNKFTLDVLSENDPEQATGNTLDGEDLYHRGDNKQLREQGEDLIWDAGNPFGEASKWSER